MLPKHIRPQLILGGPLRGSRIVTSWHDYPAAILGSTERPLIDWMRRNVKIGQTWLDVGAHYGYTTLALSRWVGSNGRVFAFEPAVETAGYLSQTRALNACRNVTILPLGLDAEPSLHRVAGVPRRGMYEAGQRAPSAIDVYLVALDAIWNQVNGNDERVDGVKIDVQGMELHTLCGMKRLLLEQHPVVVLEFHAGVDRGSVNELLASCGYDVGHVKAVRDDLVGNPLRDDESYVFA